MWASGCYVMIVMAIIAIVVKCEQQVPCYFIFGDSISDVGNNNDLNTLAKANYSPYGVDFPGGLPTGRFSNGLIFADRLAVLLGFTEFIQPYSTARGQQIQKGVNYASGAAGILPQTGRNTGARISLDQQIANHVKTIGKLGLMLGLGLPGYLRKCLYTVNIGSNDYLNNYFMPQKYITSRIYTPQQYADVLISQYGRQLRTLYSTGARKVAVFGLGQIGCIPAEIITFGTTNGSACVDKVNQAADLFNQRLIPLIDQLNTLPGANFTYIGSGSGGDTGSLVVNATCCQVLREDFQCKEGSPICPDRNNFVFWDGFHTTQLFNMIVAETAYIAVNPNNVHPVDIKTLVSS